MKKNATQLKLVSLWISLLKIITIVTTLSLLSCTKKESSLKTKNNLNTFSFNLPREVKDLDPLLVRGINQRYVLFNIHRGLFYYNQDNKLTPHGAKECTAKNNYKSWTCQLEELFYHNQKKITSQDYINTYETIKTLNEESLSSIDNINSINSDSDYKLTFQLNSPNPNFLHQLTSLNLAPRESVKVYTKEDKDISFSGPYYVEHLNESEILLKPNSNYKNLISRVSVKGLFVDESTTSLSLYETKRIDFLRYLETSLYPKYKDKAFLSPHVKLDGLFFNPKIPIEVRKALTHSLKFEELKRIFSSEGLPGCLQLTNTIFDNLKPMCYTFKNGKARLNYAEKLKISVPAISQKDHVRLAEWLKSEWEKHLSFNADIEQIEPKIFYQKANAGELEIYRRSVPLNELHCDHAKKTLLDLPEFKNHSFKNKEDCKAFFKEAFDLYLWIPLGLVHLPHLHSQKFEGYYVNLLDQFGLENLKRRVLTNE
jgi:MarR-like DNA-binding transcriptional regulator SgrR of sgrS sRNA